MPNRAQFNGIGIVLCTAGGTLLLIRDPLSKSLPGLPHLWQSFLDAGILLCILGLLAFVIPLVIGAGKPIHEGMEHVLFPGIESLHFRRFASTDDVAALHGMYVQYFGAEVPSEQLMHAWMERCKTVFVLIYREGKKANLSTKDELVGSFKFVPLTAAGARAIELGQATGSNLKPEHICSTAARASAYYIGDVFATDRIARAVVLHELQAECRRTTGEARYYARPLTPQGLRVMIRRGFVQISDGASKPQIGKLCRLDAILGQAASSGH